MADNQNEVSNTATEIALLRQTMTQVLQGQSDIKDLFSKQLSDHETRLRSLEKSTVEISARLTLWQIAQTIFTTTASAIAAIIGRTA